MFALLHRTCANAHGSMMGTMLDVVVLYNDKGNVYRLSQTTAENRS